MNLGSIENQILHYELKKSDKDIQALLETISELWERVEELENENKSPFTNPLKPNDGPYSAWNRAGL